MRTQIEVCFQEEDKFILEEVNALLNDADESVGSSSTEGSEVELNDSGLARSNENVPRPQSFESRVLPELEMTRDCSGWLSERINHNPTPKTSEQQIEIQAATATTFRRPISERRAGFFSLVGNEGLRLAESTLSQVPQ